MLKMFLKAIKVCKCQVKIQMGNPKTMVVLLLMFLYIRGIVMPIVQFSINLQENVNQWIFPVLMSDKVFPVIFIIGFIFLICDAPFINGSYLHIIKSAGKRAWVIGEVLFVVAAAFLYILFNVAFIFINEIPHFTIAGSQDWGKVIGTLTYTNAGEAYHMLFSCEPGVVGKYLPGEAMLKVSVLTGSTLILLGILIFLFNYMCEQGVGTMVAIGVTVLDITIYNFLPFAVRQFSPVSLCRLSLLYGESWQEKHAYIFLGSLILLEIVVCLLYVEKKKGIKCQEVE